MILDDREIIDSEFVEVTPDDLPDWFDEKLFKMWVEKFNANNQISHKVLGKKETRIIDQNYVFSGQEFYIGNLLGFGAAHITGLTAIIAVPDILEVTNSFLRSLVV